MAQIIAIALLVLFIFFLGRKYERNKNSVYNAFNDSFDPPLK